MEIGKAKRNGNYLYRNIEKLFNQLPRRIRQKAIRK